jgi:hypothetical protein
MTHLLLRSYLRRNAVVILKYSKNFKDSVTIFFPSVFSLTIYSRVSDCSSVPFRILSNNSQIYHRCRAAANGKYFLNRKFFIFFQCYWVAGYTFRFIFSSSKVQCVRYVDTRGKLTTTGVVKIGHQP